MSYNRATSIQARFGADIKPADQWRDYIAGGRSKTSRPVANNTTARLLDGGVAIRLHNTDIVIVNDDNTYTLNSGGWLTVTTKERINRYTPAGIYQRNGVWYIDDQAGNKTLFYDGMRIDARGYPLDPKQPEGYERDLKTIKKQAREYARGYVTALKAGEIDYPSGGDCWYCAMFENTSGADTREVARSVGADHIRQHITERYYVPSLLVNAGRDAGYRDDQIGLMGIGGQRVFIDPERVLYRYIVKRLQGEL